MVIDSLERFDSAAGNAVFSVLHTDVIHFGHDLAAWFGAVFGVPLQVRSLPAPPAVSISLVSADRAGPVERPHQLGERPCGPRR